MKTATATATISTISVSDARLCDLAKQAFELGLRDGGNGANAKPRRSGKLDEALLPNGIKRQRKVLRRTYDAAFKFQKKRKDPQGIEMNRVEAVALADTLDGLSSALFLVDADGKVMHANASGQAMLQTQEVVYAPGAKLTATELQADRALQDVIAAAALGDAIGTERGASLPLRGPKGENHVAHVLPLGFGRRREAGANYFAVAAVFVRKAEFELTHPVEALARRYKLTAAEMRVLMAIVEVGGVPEVAEALEVSQATVKTHLSRLFDKTGTNRQADLVKIVAGFASPIA